MIAPQEEPDGPAPCIVSLPAGMVGGRLSEGICHFFGIPYAAPPVGARRFALPEPPEPWSDVRDCTQAGDKAPQRLKPFPGLNVVPLVGGRGEVGEDYLTLNVWAPKGAQRAPVMVFIHGGGFVIGTKDALVSDGTAFARSGLVCVAINYRLGIEGFLPIPGVPTNLGLRDMLAALAWVRDTIHAFGGDPDNVTVFGESAGAMAIADLVASPLADGLFRRAIVQSGHGSMVREIHVARRLVKKLAKVLKVGPDVEGFRTVSTEQALDATERVSMPTARIDLRDAAGHEPVYGISRFVPVYGDDVLPDHPLAALRKGAGAKVDLLIGTNSEEMNLYLVPTGVRAKIGGLLSRWLLGKSHPRAGKVLKAYGLGTRGRRPGEALNAAMNDLVFRWPARLFAAAHQGRTHMYEFDWRSPAFDGALGACHGIELPFVFDTLDVVTGPDGLAGTAPPQALATRTHRLWVDFARDGSLPWPEFEEGGRIVYQIERAEAVSEPVMPAAAHLPA